MAITALRSGRPGPVMLEMPVDVAAEEFTGPITHTPVRPIKSAADPGAVEEAAERLLRSASPLIWAGQGVLYADASAELQAVAELLGAPVMTTLQGKSAFNERHELSAGVGAYVETGMVAHYLAHSDTLLAVGTSLSLAPFTPQIPDGKTIVHATNDPTDLHKIYPADVAICADAKLFLAQLPMSCAPAWARRRKKCGGARSPGSPSYAPLGARISPPSSTTSATPSTATVSSASCGASWTPTRR